MSTVVVIGTGETSQGYEAPAGVDIAAVSSGIYRSPWPAAHWFCLDRPRFYFGNFIAMAERIHVPIGAHCHGRHPMTSNKLPGPGLLVQMMKARVEWEPGWRDWPNTEPWAIELATPNSFMMAVEILPRLGYRHLHFVGCDFADGYCPKTLEAARTAWPLAAADGQLWTCSSEQNRLSDFLMVTNLCKPQSPALSLAS